VEKKAGQAWIKKGVYARSSRLWLGGKNSETGARPKLKQRDMTLKRKENREGIGK